MVVAKAAPTSEMPPVAAGPAYPPLSLDTGELIWLYQVRQNRQTIDAGGSGAPQPYLIFSSGHVPFCGEARFDVNRYSYSNYSSAYD